MTILKLKTINRRKQRLACKKPSQFHRRIRMSSSLSPELKQKYQFRSFPVCSGDTVKITSGQFKGKTGKVLLCIRREMKITVEGCDKIINGKQVPTLIDTSNVQITAMNINENRERALTSKKEAFSKTKQRVGRV